MDGGCFILARAIQIWLGGRIAALVRVSLRWEQTADHFVLSREGLFFDAEGVHTRKELVHRWNRFIFRDGPTILEDPADVAFRFVGILRNESMSQVLAEVLQARFPDAPKRNLRRILGVACSAHSQGHEIVVSRVP